MVLFASGGSSPVFCQDNDTLREMTFCSSPSASRQDWVCGSREVCTRSCQCWDGEQVRSSDIEAFTGVSIEEQGSYRMSMLQGMYNTVAKISYSFSLTATNPVISVSEEAVQARSSVVTDFLNSEVFMEIVPEGLSIFDIPDSDGSPPLVSVSAALVTSATLLGLFCASNL